MDFNDINFESLRKSISSLTSDISQQMDNVQKEIADENERKYAAQQASVRTALATEQSIFILNNLMEKVDKLADALETEGQLRQEADKKNEEIAEKNLKTAGRTLIIAILTLIANALAVILAIIFNFR